MANGPDTHEWRISQLEKVMEKMESRMNWAMVVLITNLVGVVITLALKAMGK